MASDDAVRPTSGTMPPPARGDVSTDARRVWRKSSTTREPLLVTSAALDVEYEDPAVHREPSGEAGVIVVDIHGPLEHHEHPCFASFENITRIRRRMALHVGDR